MRYLVLSILLVSFSAWSKPTQINFSEALNQDVAADIKKDEDKYKPESRRAPASVEEDHENTIEDTPKIDKNVRQIGPNKW